MADKKHGFTLLELSIVLLVIGLIIAGIVVGKTMIRQGEIRNALGEEDRYMKAIKEFQDKYDALPGDMKTAETIWGSDSNCPGTASNTIPKTVTCNGDGSGTIGSSDVMSNFTHTTEWWRAWQQLANAKFILGKYTGAQGPGGASEAVVGINVPASDLDTAGWTLLYYLLSCNGDLWSDQYGHIMALGAYKSTDYTRNPVLHPTEAKAMDEKIDDGNPGSGKVRAWRTTVLSNCTINDTAQTSQAYNVNYNGYWACSLVFLLGF